MDAENYSDYAITQFEEDNILRELNKCLLAFRQNTPCTSISGSNQRERRTLSTTNIAAKDNKDGKEQRVNSIQRR